MTLISLIIDLLFHLPNVAGQHPTSIIPAMLPDDPISLDRISDLRSSDFQVNSKLRVRQFRRGVWPCDEVPAKYSVYGRVRRKRVLLPLPSSSFFLSSSSSYLLPTFPPSSYLPFLSFFADLRYVFLTNWTLSASDRPCASPAAHQGPLCVENRSHRILWRSKRRMT